MEEEVQGEEKVEGRGKVEERGVSLVVAAGELSNLLKGLLDDARAGVVVGVGSLDGLEEHLGALCRGREEHSRW